MVLAVQVIIIKRVYLMMKKILQSLLISAIAIVSYEMTRIMIRRYELKKNSEVEVTCRLKYKDLLQ